MSSRAFVIIDLSAESSSIDDGSIESKIDPYSATLRSFYTKPLSSNCEKVIILPVPTSSPTPYQLQPARMVPRRQYERGEGGSGYPGQRRNGQVAGVQGPGEVISRE